MAFRRAAILAHDVTRMSGAAIRAAGVIAGVARRADRPRFVFPRAQTGHGQGFRRPDGTKRERSRDTATPPATGDI